MRTGQSCRHWWGPTARLAARHWPLLLVLTPLALVEVGLDAGLALGYRYLIDQALLAGDAAALAAVGAFLATFVLVAVGAALVRDNCFAGGTARMLAELRQAIFAASRRLSLRERDRFGQGEVLARFTTDLAGLEAWLTTFVSGFLLPALSVLVGIVLLCYLVPWGLAVAGTVIWPVVLFGTRLLAPGAAEASYRKKADEAALLERVTESGEIDLLARVYDLGGYLRERLQVSLVPLTGSLRRSVFRGAVVESLTVTMIYAVQVAAVFVGGVLVLRRELSLGSLVAFLSVFWNLGWSLVVVARGTPALVGAATAVRRIDELLTVPDDPLERRGGPAAPPLREALALEGVSLTYPSGQTVLHEVSLRIGRGETVALVGPSGSGKSSVINLLARFHPPSQGTVRLDGVDVAEYDTASLRSQMAFVLQDSSLIDASVAENIRLGRLDAGEDEIIEAARQAELHDTITGFPDGYATRVGPNGQRLSGGQRTRVDLARALLRRPAILVLDEVTADLDPTTEAAIVDTLRTVSQGRGCLTIAHRLNTVRHADRLYVLNDGRVVEQGRHDELLDTDGVYAGLWRKQAGLVTSRDGSSARVSVAGLRRMALFAPLTDEQLELLTGRFESQRVAAGEEIVRQGGPGDLFYLIVQGRCSVTRDQGDGPVEVGRLGSGDEFGEVALLTDEPRNATVTALTSALLLSLSRHSFQDLLEQYPEIRDEVTRLAEERVPVGG